MENKLQEIQPHGTLSTLSKREKIIAKKLLEVNLLIAFKLDSQDIAAWSSELNRLMSAEDLRKIPFILDCFKTEELDYDKTVGIQNFFRAVKRVQVLEDGSFKVLKAIY